jgi:hypothetical protein
MKLPSERIDEFARRDAVDNLSTLQVRHIIEYLDEQESRIQHLEQKANVFSRAICKLREVLLGMPEKE